ncbi:uncharacterized protein [Chelonus insularis]|uniref:uncharacterized protein isoform X2 n=1 Tax=Chelonus insularis TaxID=460826 RepID=UPI00158DD186|nr:uncharacterized protein LOC118072994 isoform X2 [Chelonus insularis]
MAWDNEKKDAWKSISSEMKIPVEEVKKKMSALMGSFRREKSRQKKYYRTGNSGYRSKWFAYDSLKFLSTKNVSQNSEDKLTKKQTSNTASDPFDHSDDIQTPNASDQETNLFNIPNPQRSKLTNGRDVDPKDSDSHEQISKSCSKRKSDDGIKINKTFQKALKLLRNADDSYDTFGKHVANELRKYNTQTLSYVKKAINDIIFEADIGKIPRPNNEYLTQQYSRQHDYLYSRRCSTSTHVPSPSPTGSPGTLVTTPVTTVLSSPSPDATLGNNDSQSL